MRIPFLLLAEDDEDDRYLFSQAINSIDPSIIYVVASNGKEVLEILENDFFSLPDYIILDLNMPLLNGMECLTAIRKNPRYLSCRVIVYSTTLEHSTEDLLRRAGAFACFVKPPVQHQLAAILRNLLGAD